MVLSRPGPYVLLNIKEIKLMNQFYPHMFEPITINNVTFKNRIFTAPSTAHMIQNNEPFYPEDSYIINYLSKAKGGVACVNLGGQKVEMTGRNPIHTEFNISDPRGWRNFIHMTDAIHFYGTKCSYELIHFGSEGEYTEEAKKEKIYGCSDFIRKDGLRFYQMPFEEMERLANRYAELAECVKFCGFDTLLVHGGHGTLLQEFLSPRCNFRTDEYGGSMENRARFPLMVLDKIRERVGRSLLIEYRISGSECVEGGFQIDECIEFTKLIQGRIDIIHISAGVVREPRLRAVTHPTGFLPPACNAYLAAAVKACPDITIPVLTVGAFQDPQIIEETLASGKADIVAMARGTIADPECINKAKVGKAEDIVPCIKCFQCLDEFKSTHFYSCSVNPEAGRETYLDMLVLKDYSKRKLAVVGGGPGGMKAAILASERGHDVILYEKKGYLGGQLNEADYMSFKYDLRKYKDYLIDQLKKSNVHIRLGTAVTPEKLKDEGFDAVFVAIGASPLIPPIPGVNGRNVIWAGDSFFQPDRIGNRIIIIGGGQVGCETAVHYGMQGKIIVLLEMRDELAADAMRTYREELIGQVYDHASAVVLKARCSGITDSGIKYTDGNGVEHYLDADTVIIAAGMEAKSLEAEEFRGCAEDFRMLGDCARVGNVKHATRAAYDAAMSL